MINIQQSLNLTGTKKHGHATFANLKSMDMNVSAGIQMDAIDADVDLQHI